MSAERVVRELRLCSRATQRGTVEVIFLGKAIELDVDQARELQRELTHSIGVASYGCPRLDTHDRILHTPVGRRVA